MMDLASRSAEGFSDSDDDHQSSITSTSPSACECWVGPRLPSSLRKLLNPNLPPFCHSPVSRSQTSDPPTPIARRCLNKEDDTQASYDLSRLRPWKKLPPPRPLNSHPWVPPTQVYYCMPPTPRKSSWAIRSCSSVTPQLNPYYLPAIRWKGESNVHVSHNQQLSSEDEDTWKNSDASVSPPIVNPSFSSRRPSNARAHAKTRTNLNTCKYPANMPDPKSERSIAPKRVNSSREKERNRCLTCGSSFSTFANLTRHEKKCPLATTTRST